MINHDTFMNSWLTAVDMHIMWAVAWNRMNKNTEGKKDHTITVVCCRLVKKLLNVMERER